MYGQKVSDPTRRRASGSGLPLRVYQTSTRPQPAAGDCVKAGATGHPSLDDTPHPALMREIKDFSGVLREAACIGGSLVVAYLVSRFTEDKGNQTSVVTIIFYLLSGAVRFLFWKWTHR